MGAEVNTGLVLLFHHDPFVKPRWIYGRREGGEYYLRGSLDPVREDVEEVLNRELGAHPK